MADDYQSVMGDRADPEKRAPSMNFHDSLGAVTYDVQANLKARGETADSITINGSTTRVTVTFQEIEDGFATSDSSWEKALADSKVP